MKTNENKEGYAWTFKPKKEKGLISMCFLTKEEALKQKHLYKNEGWKCDLIRVNLPKPLTEEEQKNIQELSKFLKTIFK